MIFSRKYTGATLAIVLFASFTFGVAMGAESGSYQDVKIDVDEEVKAADIGDGESEPPPPTLRPIAERVAPLVPEIESPLDPYIRGGVIALAETMLRVAFQTANVGSYIGATLLWWMPAIVIRGVGQLALIGIVAKMLLNQFYALQDARETHQ